MRRAAANASDDIDIKSCVRTVPDYPKPGIMFRDITSLLADAAAFRRTIDLLVARYEAVQVDKIAGIEARGFIIGAALASHLGVGFIPVRKKNKLPPETVGEDYALEYGVDRVEVRVDAISPGERILLVDDLIATGGTAMAAIRLIEILGGTVVETCFVIDLPDLGGRKKIEAVGKGVFTLCEFEGD